ncbi:MAG: nitroreductase family protein [Candidatus Nitrosotenuis sp.]
MSEFSRVEASYIAKDGCRIVWKGIDEDDQDVVVLGKEELNNLTEILSKDSTGKVELEDEFSTILINTDTTQFRLKEGKTLEVNTSILTKNILEYKKIPHASKPIKVYPKEFLPSIQIEKEDSANKQLNAVFVAKNKKTVSESDLFRVMSTRRSTRNFDTSRLVEQWKIDKILAAADTAPTAGNFQGFEVFLIKNKEIKKRLVEAANNQPYVNAPVVLVFCMDQSRVKMNFRPEILAKFSLQDATLAAAYSQLAASALGLSTIWIGMINEEKVKQIIGTDLKPSSILCIGYPQKSRPPKSRRKLKDLVRTIE